MQEYYPPDLPAEWRLAYYANDCGCVLLPPEAWCRVDRVRLELVLDESPDSLRVFLQAPDQAGPALQQRLEIFAPYRTVLLVRRPVPGCRGFAQWIAQGPDSWVDTDSGAALVRWSVDRFDLRDLRARAESLDPRVRALVLDGPGADPGVIPKLRQMLELMGLG